jgi:hypothetical protein
LTKKKLFSRQLSKLLVLPLLPLPGQQLAIKYKGDGLSTVYGALRDRRLLGGFSVSSEAQVKAVLGIWGSYLPKIERNFSSNSINASLNWLSIFCLRDRLCCLTKPIEGVQFP